MDAEESMGATSKKEEMEETMNEPDMDASIVPSVVESVKKTSTTSKKPPASKPKEKKLTKKELENKKKEDSYKSLAKNKEELIKASYRESAAMSEEKKIDIAYEKKMKAKIEMAKLAKLNMGPKEFLKQQNAEKKKGMANKMI